MKNRAGTIKLTALLIALACAAGARAQSVPASDEDELALTYGDGMLVSIATGTRQPLVRAPAVASVITARDIAAMGATDLDQVLESVAGLHVSYWGAPLNPAYIFRGINTNYNSQVLMLVNGQPITSSFTGNRGQAWGGLPLENVARIEIIRGPGSALYGADAFSGVINVITKTADDVSGLALGVRAGSLSTRDAWIQWGGRLGPVAAAFYARTGRTDGSDRIIDVDVQSGLDPLFGTHASLAPGRINAYRRAADLHADLAWGDWHARLTYQDRVVGIGAGLADAVDPYGRAPEKRAYADLSYTKENWLPGFDVSAVLGTYNIRNDGGAPAYRLFPAGAFGGAFPDGVIGNPGHSERHHYLSLSGVFTNWQQHRVRIGAGYRVEDMYSTSEEKNFSFVVVPGVGPALLPLGYLLDARTKPELLHILPHQRELSYVFGQDEWNLAKDWTLTAGVRYDHYSDFGATTNPRLALVWDANYNLVIKAMHGRAFRAPTFVEQYSANNPVNIGNPHLNPERIATSELAANWTPHGSTQVNLTLFRYHMKNIITTVANADPSTGRTFQNTGDQTGRGFELETIWQAAPTLRLSGNLSVQHSTDEATGHDAGFAPRRHLFGRAEWNVAPTWTLSANANHVADRARQPGDTRPAIPGYTTVDLSLLKAEIMSNWEFRATLLNAFDRDVREPTIAPGNIPHDLPMAGRTFAVQLAYRH